MPAGLGTFLYHYHDYRPILSANDYTQHSALESTMYDVPCIMRVVADEAIQSIGLSHPATMKG